MKLRCVVTVLVLSGAIALARPAAAQQRPLVTQDPESIGAGRVLIEGGVDYEHDAFYPLSGLKGNLWKVPTIGLSVGISSIAEVQITGGPFDTLAITERRPGPLADAVTATGGTTHAVDDLVVALKIRLAGETASRPAFGIRFATRLPNAKHESGMGQDTTDFYMSILGAKTVQSLRVVGNIGLGIMSEPLTASKQNDVLTYGLSFARAMTQQAEVVGELNGRISTRNGTPPVGTESTGILKLGGRYTRGSVRLDAGVYFGLTSVAPTIGFTTGFTYVFNAFSLP
jgi:hypothetical protein